MKRNDCAYLSTLYPFCEEKYFTICIFCHQTSHMGYSPYKETVQRIVCQIITPIYLEQHYCLFSILVSYMHYALTNSQVLDDRVKFSFCCYGNLINSHLYSVIDVTTQSLTRCSAVLET